MILDDLSASHTMQPLPMCLRYRIVCSSRLGPNSVPFLPRFRPSCPYNQSSGGASLDHQGLFCELNHDDDDFSTTIWHVLFRLFFSSFSLLFSFLSSLPWIWHFVWRSSLLIDSFWLLFLSSVQYFYICFTSKYHGVNTFWSPNICSEQQLSNYFKQQKNKKKESFFYLQQSIHSPIITSHVNTPCVRSRDFFCTFFNCTSFIESSCPNGGVHMQRDQFPWRRTVGLDSYTTLHYTALFHVCLLLLKELVGASGYVSCFSRVEIIIHN